MDKQNIGYWKFLLDKLKQENIHPDNIMMVLEKKLWFPKQNYSTFINYFESLHLDFINQSIAANSANPALANGEGVALGYALYKSKLNYRNVVETFI